MLELILFCFMTAVPISETEQWAEAIQTANEGNRALFPYGSLRFEYAQGRAASYEAAIRGEPASVSVASGLYIFDGPHARYERIHSVEDMAADLVKVPEGWMHTLSSCRLLTDGRVTLFDFLRPSGPDPGAVFLHDSQINPGTTEFYSQITVPIRLGDPEGRNNLVELLRRISRQETDFRLVSIDENERLDSSNVVLFTLESARSIVRYWVDLERGAITRQRSVISKSGGPSYLERNSDIRPIAGKGWLPFKWDNAIDNVVKRLTIVEADFEHRPDQSRFAIEFEAPIAMVNAADYVKYEPQKVWNLRDLPPASSSSATPIPRPGAGDAAVPMAMPGERDPRPWWGLPTLLSGVVLLFLAGRKFFRMRTHER